MKLQDQITNLLHQFETAIFKGAQTQIAQKGTTELFFDNAANQQQFASIIQDPKSAPGKILLNSWNKSKQLASFHLAIIAEPGKGARWILNVHPTDLTPLLATALNVEFQKLMKTSMGEKLKRAIAATKEGAGNGQLTIGSLEIS